jgi:hypothetical protein
MMSLFWPVIPPVVLVCCWAVIRLRRALAAYGAGYLALRGSC